MKNNSWSKEEYDEYNSWDVLRELNGCVLTDYNEMGKIVCGDCLGTGCEKTAKDLIYCMIIFYNSEEAFKRLMILKRKNDKEMNKVFGGITEDETDN